MSLRPDRIPLFPLRQPLQRQGLLSLQIFEVRYLDLIKRLLRSPDQLRGFGVVMLREGDEVQKPGHEEAVVEVGCFARLVETNALQPALFHVLCQGTERFRVRSAERGRLGLWTAEVEWLDEQPVEAVPPDAQPLADRLGSLIASLQKEGVPEARMPMLRPYALDEAGWVADRWSEILPLSPTQRQAILIEDSPLQRLRDIQRIAGAFF